MRRKKRAFARGRVISLLVAAGIGYVIGSWNATAVRRSEASDAPTAAQTVALRFPQAMSDAPVVQAASIAQQAAAAPDNAEVALFEPTPMMPSPVAVSAPAVRPMAQPAPGEQIADITPPPVEPPPSATAPISPRSRAPVAAVRPHPAAPHLVSRPRSMFDEAQLAGIKRRLHLTPDQESMWPAVAAALRNIDTERERDARRGAPGAIDPDSAEVQNLKSAAIPLLMSFSDEQKDEVRNLAHNMGLDQLASEF
jgi:hypothetical protein